MNSSRPVSFVRLLGAKSELHDLQRLFAGLSAATRAFVGEPEARRLLGALPPGKTRDDKFLFGVRAAEEWIGCCDVIRGYPDDACAFVGLLVFSENRRRRGFGGRCWKMAEDLIAVWPSVRRVRLGVAEGNRDAEAFWSAVGFSPTGEKSVSLDEHWKVSCSLFEKPSVPAGAGTSRLAAAEEFATAMDGRDFGAAQKLLAEDCRYRFRGEALVGRDAILRSYRDNAEWAEANLERVDYEHGVGPGSDGTVVLSYLDRVRHAGRVHEHFCRQTLHYDEAGSVILIEHEDLPGESERLAGFLVDVGVRR